MNYSPTHIDLRPAELKDIVNEVIPLLEPLARQFDKKPDVQQEIRRCRNLLKGKPSEGTDFTGLPYFSKTVHSQHESIPYCLIAACTAFLACYYELYLKRGNGDYAWEKNKRRLGVLSLYLKNLASKPIESWKVIGNVKTGYHLKVS